jgi:hypothetical protein
MAAYWTGAHDHGSGKIRRVPGSPHPDDRTLGRALSHAAPARKSSTDRSMMVSKRIGEHATSASFLMTFMTIASLWSGTAVATDTCITKPTLQGAEDGRWNYQIDWLNHRRCWYVERMGRTGSQISLHGARRSRKPSPSTHPANERTRFRGPPKSQRRQPKDTAPGDRASRDALFQEFLQWQRRERSLGSQQGERD